MQFNFPKKLLLGAASAATQIEGGKVDGNWHDWYRKGKIADNSNPEITTMHWKYWKEDSLLLKEAGVQTYRMGLDWARIYPRENEVDYEAVWQYRNEILLIKEQGIKPLLTLHHFSNPMWFERMGGFLNTKALIYFLNYVKFAAETFGDLVEDFVTVNEPNVYTFKGYGEGSWPPGCKNPFKIIKVLENLAYCHIESYKIIHETRKKMGFLNTKVGFANHLRVFDPKNEKNPFDKMAARLSEYTFQEIVTRAFTLGEFCFPLRNKYKIEKGVYVDFHGVNYYSRTVNFMGVRKNSPRNDLNWEIYPKGLIRCAEKLDEIKRLPIWVTENGTCDNNDAFRCRFIAEHLKAICESDLPFERYYHWCFCDNFEWADGCSMRFGLIHLNYETQARTVKRSAEFYKKIIKAGSITKELWNEYVEPQKYNIK